MDFATIYVDAFKALSVWTGYDNPLLHVHAGLAVYAISQFALSERRASVHGLACVVFAAVLHEGIQAWHYRDFRWNDTIADLAITMFWPFVIVVLGQYKRRRFNRRQARAVRVASDRVPRRGRAAVRVARGAG
jgi:hypothetical protein